jgi:hypothetical protein
MIPYVPGGRSRVRELLGIELPLIQAPVGSATSVELAAAVSEAGPQQLRYPLWRNAQHLCDVPSGQTRPPRFPRHQPSW